MSRRVYILMMVGCLAVGQLMAQGDYTVERLRLSGSYSNKIFAVPYEDGVIYSSDRRTHVLVNRVDSANRPLFHLFYAPLRDSARWGVSRLLSKHIPVNAHLWTCTLNASGSEMYFSANDAEGQRIFVAGKGADGWDVLRPFVHNRPGSTTTHPSLSSDGERLFFASDMEGGFGGFDVYVCVWTPRGWGTPVNLGATVNTEGDELYPFIQGNGVLYFSSTAHGSMGGLDIFAVSELYGGGWGIPTPMGDAVNSPADDISYTAADEEGTAGFIASNRDGGMFDLFAFRSLFPLFPDCNEQEENDYTYWFEERGEALLDTTSLKLLWDMGDGTMRFGEEIEHTFASTGQYEIRLSVIDTLTGEVQKEVAQYPLEVVDIEQPYISANGTFRAGTPVAFDGAKTFLPQMEVGGYFWMFGDGTRARGVHAEHVFAAPGIYRVQLGVIGESIYTGEGMKVCTFRDVKIE